MDTTVDLIHRKLTHDKDVADAVSAKLSIPGRSWSDADISAYFPEYKDQTNGRSNLPRGLSLTHHLLVGPPPVFDIEPLPSSDVFSKRYGITLKAVEELAEAGLVLPNLYVRSPNEWANKPHMESLLQYSVSNGVRVDAYFEAREPRYAELVAEHAQHLEQVLQIAERENPDIAKSFVAGSRSARVDAPRTIGTRWAYLDVLAPDISERVATLVNDGGLLEAAELILLSKHLYVSPISAAIGGDFIWPKDDLAKINRVNEYERPLDLSSVAFQSQRERLEFLVHRITGIRPFRALDRYDQSKLITLLKDRDFNELKGKIRECLAAMAALFRKGEVSEDAVDEWIRLYKEIQDVHDKTIKRTAGVEVLGLGVGFVVNPQLAVAMGLYVHLLKPDLIKNLGNSIHQIVNPERHRLILAVEGLGKR